MIIQLQLFGITSGDTVQLGDRERWQEQI